MLFMMSDSGGPYLNARLKNCAFPGVDENNKNGCMSAGLRDAWKRAKVCSIQWQPPDTFITLQGRWERQIKRSYKIER